MYGDQVYEAKLAKQSVQDKVYKNKSLLWGTTCMGPSERNQVYGTKCTE